MNYDEQPSNPMNIDPSLNRQTTWTEHGQKMTNFQTQDSRRDASTGTSGTKHCANKLTP